MRCNLLKNKPCNFILYGGIGGYHLPSFDVLGAFYNYPKYILPLSPDGRHSLCGGISVFFWNILALSFRFCMPLCTYVYYCVWQSEWDNTDRVQENSIVNMRPIVKLNLLLPTKH